MYFREGFERVLNVLRFQLLKEDSIEYASNHFENLTDELKQKHVSGLVKDYLDKFRIKKILFDEKTDILFYGNTKNNQRELEFILDKASIYTPNLTICNLHGKKIIKDRKLNKLEINKIYNSLFEVIAMNILDKEVFIKYFLMYLGEYINFFFLLNDKKIHISYTIVANDHSPASVAISMVAKELNIKRVYLQHAAVSKIFPHLDFEYAILRDYSSYEIYKSIGISSKCRVIIQPRFLENFKYDNLKKNLKELQSNKVKIVIYLTSVFDNNKLLHAVQELKNNVLVDSVSIKPHPRIKSSQLLALSNEGIDIVTNVSRDIHLAIVSNSSVVIELLHAGVPVMQCFELDPFEEDYYTFVSQGIVQKVDINSMKINFWNSIDYNQFWFEKYTPLDSTLSKTRRSDELKFIHFLFEMDGSYKWDDYKYNMYLRISPITFFQNIHTLKNVDQLYIIKTLESMLNNRDPYFNTILDVIEKVSTLSMVYIWLYIKNSMWTGFVISKRQEAEMKSYVYSFKEQSNIDKKLKSKLLTVLLTYFIREQSIEDINCILQKEKYFNLNKLHLNTKIALKKLLNENPDKLIIKEKHIFNSLSKFHEFKLNLLTMSDTEYKNLNLNYQIVKNTFIALAPSKIASEFEELDLKFNEISRENNVYFDVRFNEEQRKLITDEIIDKLKKCEPYSFIRLSDGEGYLFNNRKVFTKYDRLNRERHWWGCQIDKEVKHKIIQNNIQAIKEVNMLGIPTVYRFLRDHSDKSTSLSQSLTGRGLLEVHAGIQKLDLKCIFTDDKANLALFSNTNILRKLASYAKRVIFIGSASSSKLLKVFSGFELVVISTSSHFKTSKNNKYENTVNDILPYMFESVLLEIDKKIKHGDLVLVGAGVVGKMFVHRAKLNGAIALDIGSVSDQLVDAGIHSLY